MKNPFLLIICIFVFSIESKVSIIFFPLENRSDTRVVEWIGYSFPEVFFRKMSEYKEIQIWDPVYIFNVDSSVWRLDSDTLIMIQQKRWKWDFAIGGFYTADIDSFVIVLKIVSVKEDKIHLIEKKVEGEMKNLHKIQQELLVGILSDLDLKITSETFMDIRGGKGDVYATYARGYGYEMYNDIPQAISAFHRVLELDKNFSPALYRIGKLYSLIRKWEEAKEFLEKALSKSPESSVIASEIAELLIKCDKYKKAQSFIDSERGLLEKSAAGMKAIGLAYIHVGKYQRAVSVLTRAVAEGPSDLETDFLLGKAYLYTGRFNGAVNVFGRLIRYRPKCIRYYSFLGEAYRKSGRLMESCNVLENAMFMEPDNVPNLISLSNTYFRLGWYNKAEQYLLRARDLNPGLGEIYVNLGVLYWHMKKPNKAVKMLNIAADDEASLQSSLNNKANILFLSGDFKHALKAYKKADKYGKKSEIIWYNLAMAYLSFGNIDKAIECFKEVLLLSPDRLDVLLKEAELLEKQENFIDAELYYRKILDLSPENKTVRNRLIALFEKQEQYDNAVKIMDEYLSKYPQDREYLIKAPDIYRKMGWYEVAAMEYRNLLKDKTLKNNADVYLGFGKCLYDLIRFKKGRDFESTIFILKKAAELNPSSYEPDMIIGFIYMDYKGYRNLAVEHWQKAYNKAKKSEVRKKISLLINKALK